MFNKTLYMTLMALSVGMAMSAATFNVKAASHNNHHSKKSNTLENDWEDPRFIGPGIRHLNGRPELDEATKALPDDARIGPWVQTTLVDRTAQERLPLYWYFGNAYVVSEPGHQYSIRLTNTSSRSVLVVVSVDGINTLTGETAGTDQGGYILGPYETYDVRGWHNVGLSWDWRMDSPKKRMSKMRHTQRMIDETGRTVTPFVFDKEKKSRAAKSGRAGDKGHLGVVGVAVYPEKASLYWGKNREVNWNNYHKTEPMDAHGLRGANNLRVVYDPTNTRSFTRESNYPSQQTAIRYARDRVLMDKGILTDNNRGIPEQNPFPRPFLPSSPETWNNTWDNGE